MKDVSFKFEPLIISKDKITEKVKYKIPKFILGTYKINKENHNNEKLDWKFLNYLGHILIVVFLVTMILGMSLIGYVGYEKILSKGLIGKTAGVGLVVPSIQKDSIKESNIEVLEYADGKRDLNDMKKRNFVFIPILLLLPILFLSTFVHEFGHYIMCRNYGLIVTDYGLGSVCIFCIPVLFFAYVEPKESEFKKIELTPHLAIASAGIIMNLLLALISLGILIIYFNYFTYLLFLLNLSLALTNVLPIAPLDGGLVIKRLAPKLVIPLAGFVLVVLGLLIFL